MSKKPVRSPRPSPLLNTPLGQLLLPFQPVSTQWFARYVIVSFVVVLRLAVGLGGYSGYQSSPMFGDFEAQRHWMEITTQLPISRWYWYDLQYWGLDYPPLTAYHSWVCGKVGHILNSWWFELDTSRGLEHPDLKSYMRLTAVLSELLLYIPLAMYYTKWKRLSAKQLTLLSTKIVSAAILIQPSLILVDHGHFQYNSVMLGFALGTIVCLCFDRYLLAASLFVFSIMFKQMALYYSLIIFAYLLGSCFVDGGQSSSYTLNLRIGRLIAIGLVTALSFGLCIAPFLWTESPMLQLLQIVHRMFPFARGLWEDKVANVWCALNVVVKLKTLFSGQQLQRLSLLATLVASVPAMIPTFLCHSPNVLPWAMSAGAWAFFLFSFQVHEKTILVPLMPLMLLLTETDHDVVSMVIWINNIATFSLWPLLQRDGLALQYCVVLLLWNWLISAHKMISRHWLLRLVVCTSYLAVVGVHVAQLYIEPPSTYPDLWVVANVLVATPCFGFCWLWTLKRLWAFV